MRKVIVSNLMSLDGFFEGPDQKLDWFVVDEEFLEYAEGMLRNADTLLFGRKTYQHMADYWPTAPADEIENQMNNLPKIVFSRTLQSAEWKNSNSGEERSCRRNFKIEAAAWQGHGDSRKRQPRIVSPATRVDRRISRPSSIRFFWAAVSFCFTTSRSGFD